jgi:hypothetical protein
MPGTVVVRVQSNRFAEIAQRLPQVVARINRDAAKAVEQTSKLSMEEPKSGRIYDMGNGRMHQASAPGEAPAVEIGKLSNSIDTAQDGRTKWVTYTDAEYAPELEFGDVDRNLAPRPFFAPAVEQERPNWLRALENLERELV